MALLISLSGGFGLLGGCATQTPIMHSGTSASQPVEDELFQALGGLEGIENIADQFLYRLADNDKVVHFWRNSNIERFRTQFVSHLCDLSGGPCVYEGDTMEAVHRGMDIRQSHFNSVAETLVLAMEDLHVPTAAINGLIARLAPLHDAVRSQLEN
ncbi:group 1 truncated hemoglobin [Allohahella marinimesophila]|uniref:Group 1 truncated hemoglobin n=2 Tax=Allohahella marinimesophila TaxID=1054972 RepID=A0ABP7PVL1_9GAMM